MKKLTIALTIVLVIVATVFFVTNDSSPTEQPKATTTPRTTAPAPDPSTPSSLRTIIGDPSAPVQIIEFVDYKCPNCNRFHREVGAELKTVHLDSGDAYLEIKHLPFIGPDSERAALGAYCAAQQQLFTAYNDAVFSHMWDKYYQYGDYAAEFQDILTVDLLVSLLEGTQLDTTSFKNCVDNKTHLSLVEADLTLASEQNVRGTPSFIIGDRVLSNNQPLSVFSALIKLQQ